MRYFIVASSRNGLEHNPNTLLVNISTKISGNFFSMSSTHRNLTTSLPSFVIPTMSKAVSKSPVSATLLVQNFKNMSKMFSVRCGPVDRHSFKLAPSDLLITAWCRRWCLPNLPLAKSLYDFKMPFLSCSFETESCSSTLQNLSSYVWEGCLTASRSNLEEVDVAPFMSSVSHISCSQMLSSLQIFHTQILVWCPSDSRSHEV